MVQRKIENVKKVRQVTQTSIVSIGENFCDRLGIVIFILLGVSF